MFNCRLTKVVSCIALIFCTLAAHAKSPFPSEEFLKDQKDLLEPVFENWNQAKFGPATPENIIAHYKKKAFKIDVIDELPRPADAIKRANALLENRFFILDEYTDVKTRANGMPDWEWYGPKDDKEWAWMLNRMAFLQELYLAWVETKNPVYIEKLDMFWKDWILSNDYPNRLSFSAQWRALEVARRILGGWIHIFYELQNEDAFSNETRLLILASVLHHADALQNHSSFWGGNHLITEQNALLALAYAWPEFSTVNEWRSSAIEKLSDELLKQSYPDGSFKELSNHYQRVILLNARQFVKLINAQGIHTEHQEILERIELMWDFFFRVMRPDGFGPLNNAADLEINSLYAADAVSAFDRQDWLYIATNGKAGSKPSYSPTALFPWAGQVIFRNDWSKDASWLYFDAGPYGSGHQHVDRLHISYFAGGKQILTDNGRYTYLPGKWSQYFKGPKSHNTLLLNGKAAEQAPKTVSMPLEISSNFNEAYEKASASALFVPEPFSFESTIPWTRTIVFFKEGFALIFDSLTLFDSNEATVIWNFHPDITENESNQYLSLVSNQPSEVTTMIGQEHPEIAGFYSRNYDEIQPSIQKQYTFKLTQPNAIVWLLKGTDSSSEELQHWQMIPLSPNEWKISFEMGNRSYSFSLELPR